MKKVVALALLVGACGSSKDPTFYALSAQPAAARSGAPALIEVRRPAVPGYLDRADVIKRIADHQLHVDSDERWGEPIGDMIGRVLADDLSTRLSGSQVFSENGAIALMPQAIVAVDVIRFDAASDGTVSLLAEVAIEVPNSPSQARIQRVSHQATPSSKDTPALVSAMSGLVGNLADDITSMLTAH